MHISEKSSNFAAQSCKGDITSMMTKEEKVAYWLDIADYDLETAEAMYKTKRWLYVAFMCHQVIEKLLKAYWTATRDDTPPYIHSHIKLLDSCGLLDQMTEEQLEFIDYMVPMNIEARYPEYKQNLAAHLNEQASHDIIEKTKLFKQWILQKF